MTDDDDEHNHQDQVSSPQPSDFVNKTTSSTNTITTNGSLLKRYTPQSRTNVLRTTPISPLILRKQRQSSVIPTNILQRPNLQSQTSPSDMKINRVIEKKSYATSSSQNADRSTQQSRLTTRIINSQTQMVTYTTITQTGRKQPNSMTPSIGRSTSFNTPKVRRNFLS